ncbi:aspartate kinase [Myxococcota bacterium]|nr:aspartate kinase [Myxococcota bacterium]
MGIVVQKYGGSSVADVDRLRAIARRVVASVEGGDHPVVVVSAMGKTTDELLGLARRISERPGRRELDMLVSVGERISMALLAMAIHDAGHRAISFTGSQSGIITDDRHFDARIVEVRPARILEALGRGDVVIVAGYQGVSRSREVTTLGRGGSDTTAVALAAALEADHCEICSDVDGVWTADPRLVPEARRIDHLSHGEVLELAHGGAKVLAATAMEYARRSGIAVWARSTFAPGPGTRVDAMPSDRGLGGAVAVAGEPSVPVVRCPGGSGAWRRLLAALDRAGLSWRHARAVDDGLEVWLDPRSHPDAAGEASRVAGAYGGGAVSLGGLGTVTVVGADAAASPSVAAGLLATVEGAGVAPRGLASTPFGVACLLDGQAVPTLIRALHRTFVEPHGRVGEGAPGVAGPGGGR